MNLRNIVVYVAGPFRGANSWEIARNIRRAEELALEAWRAGFAVICPHANTAHYQGALPDKVWLDGDLEILSRCDAVLLTQDWPSSKGAAAEKEFAEQCEIPVFRSLPELERWASDEVLADRCAELVGCCPSSPYFQAQERIPVHIGFPPEGA